MNFCIFIQILCRETRKYSFYSQEYLLVKTRNKSEQTMFLNYTKRWSQSKWDSFFFAYFNIHARKMRFEESWDFERESKKETEEERKRGGEKIRPPRVCEQTNAVDLSKVKRSTSWKCHTLLLSRLPCHTRYVILYERTGIQDYFKSYRIWSVDLCTDQIKNPVFIIF